MNPSSLPSRGARVAGFAFFFTLLAAAPLPASQRGISTVPAPVRAPGSSAIDLPAYQPPPAFSEDLTIHSMGQTIVMKRAIDHGKARTDMTVEGMNVVMLEMGDDKGTSYMLMADQKMALKQSRQATEALVAAKGKKKADEVATSDEAELTPADYKVEDLGDDMVGGVVARKMRVTMKDGDVLGWFEKATGAPLRMEGTVQGERADMAWQNRKVAPQSSKLFEVPKGYQTIDFDDLMSKVSSPGSMSGMPAGMPGIGAMPGMAGFEGMMSGRAVGMGQSLGESLGGKIGGALGGPLGSIAGRYLGRKIGALLGKKAVGAVIR